MKMLVEAVLAFTAGALAMPHADTGAEKRQSSHPVDFVEGCRGWQPNPGDCGLLTATGVEVAWDGGNLGNSASDNVGVLLDDACGMVDHGTYEGTGSAHEIFLEFPSGREFHAEVSWIGSDDIEIPLARIDGEQAYPMDCQGFQSSLDGLDAGFWRMCAFPC